jgi:hypothetical protein
MLFLFLIWCSVSYAVNLSVERKDVFAATDVTLMVVENQQGNVVIRPSNDDSVRIHYRLNVSLDSYSDSASFFEGINLSVHKKGKTGYVVLKTNPLLVSNFDYTSSVTIFAPDSMLWNISHKFGSIITDSTLFIQRLILDYGKFSCLSIQSIQGRMAELRFFQSEVSINNIDRTLMTVKNATVSVGNLQSGIIKSEFSILKIDKANEADITSETDNIFIGSIDKLTFYGLYSSLNIGFLKQSLESEIQYGNFELKGASATFGSVNLNHKNTATTLQFAKNVGYILNADLKYCNLQLDAGIVHKLKFIEDFTDKQAHGIIGINDSVQSSVNIVAINEDVHITLPKK